MWRIIISINLIILRTIKYLFAKIVNLIEISREVPMFLLSDALKQWAPRLMKVKPSHDKASTIVTLKSSNNQT